MMLSADGVDDYGGGADCDDDDHEGKEGKRVHDNDDDSDVMLLCLFSPLPPFYGKLIVFFSFS